MITAADLKAARDVHRKARKRAEKTSQALYKVTELVRKRGAENAAAEAAYNRLRDAFVDQAIEEGKP